MRIVGGLWRGRRLTAIGAGDAAAHLRPTTDRVRESIFNLLLNSHGLDLDGARVLDVFAGTGALGLEALSRGAAHATFVESGRTALAILRENVALLEAPATILAQDVRRIGAGTPHDLILLDPPYGKGMGEAVLDALRAGGWLAPGATIMWEDGAAPRLPSFLSLADQRSYGGTVVTLATA
ncbi:16S rRNA (guanine(966)-N(2))-methyltransferase RsmD [uncultured Jannaschia sp.]|uniref:16S rRNA (guanine(966)-N(2))-methyltransferase RsmD n=1 Tax=uncultured Jannaschia sp. TaxID=293347 RepID=UPI00261736D0|nr:16S rRNA (guanine(966)-N(2))-methyltransferase RsmD [uncultured Jannaschia sp.]